MKKQIDINNWNDFREGDVLVKVDSSARTTITVEREMPLPEVRVGDIITYDFGGDVPAKFGPITQVLAGDRVYVGEELCAAEGHHRRVQEGGERMMPICFVDTETTGLHTDKQLWEVAIIRRRFYEPGEVITYINGETAPVPGKYEETRYEAFVPVDLSNADLFGLNVGRFYERHPLGKHLSGGKSVRDWWDETWSDELDEEKLIAQRIAQMTHGARFIGAAPSFDAEVLGDFLRRHQLLPTWNHRLVDTHDLLTGYILGKGWVEPDRVLELSKDDKVELIGLELHVGKRVHTAMGDAQHEADIWDAIMG